VSQCGEGGGGVAAVMMMVRRIDIKI